MIRLFVIEDHLAMVLSSLRFMFRPRRDGIEITGFARTPEEAIHSDDTGCFDIFILDLFLPGLQPVDNIRMLKQYFPDKPVIILTGEKSSAWCNKMRQEGASAYISKDSSRELIGLAINKVASGEHFFVEDSAASAENPSKELCAGELTPVESKIAKLLSQGLMHKEIASQMGISRSMIEKILKRLRLRYQVNNNLELIRILTANRSL